MIQPISTTPTHRLQALSERVKQGATVDAAFVAQALHELSEVELPAAQAFVRDIMATSTSTTPAAHEALSAFVKASAPRTEVSPLLATLAQWLSRSPPPARSPGADKLIRDDAVIAASTTLHRSPKDTLLQALQKIDSTLAAAVSLETKYAVGVEGFSFAFPELKAALTQFSAAHEPASTLMDALLQSLPKPQPFAALAAQVKGGATIDRRLALELMRAATAEGTPDHTLRQVVDGATTTDAAKAFVGGWLQSRGGNVAAKYQDALYAEWGARHALSLFDAALADLDPKLAAVSHTQLLMSDKHPALASAYEHIKADASDVRNEALSAIAQRHIAAALSASA